MREELIDEEWILRENFIHLNHAAVGPWPKRTQLAIQNFASENAQQGSWNYLQWLEIEKNLRKQIQSLVNAPDWRDIALLKNTSEALSVVAYGLNWKKGDNVVISNEEFPSNHIVWESLKDQGVEIRYADLSNRDTAEQALCHLCDENTRLLSISSVQYASGLKVNLNQLGEFCRNNDILFCIDAIQNIGAEIFDVQACKADFVVADGHKWMLGPEGVALFYCRAEVRDSLQLNQYGWHMVEHPSDFDKADWKVANYATRFECGSPNMLGIHGLHASLSLLLDIGMEIVEAKVRGNANYLFDQLNDLPNIELLSPSDEKNRTGIINFRSKTVNNEQMFDFLTKQDIFCAKRGKGIRFSAHYYTPRAQLDKVLNLIADQSSL